MVNKRELLMFWRNVLPPSSDLKNKLTKQQAVLLVCFTYSLTLKMGPVHFIKMLVNFYHTTWPHIPEDGTLHSHL
jgi:hypothetical protein